MNGDKKMNEDKIIKIYYQDELMKYFEDQDELDHKWVKGVCEECSCGDGVKYFNTKDKTITCQHRLNYYLLTRKEINTLLSFASKREELGDVGIHKIEYKLNPDGMIERHRYINLIDRDCDGHLISNKVSHTKKVVMNMKDQQYNKVD